MRRGVELEPSKNSNPLILCDLCDLCVGNLICCGADLSAPSLRGLGHQGSERAERTHRNELELHQAALTQGKFISCGCSSAAKWIKQALMKPGVSV
jgi:hypothetical protein